MKEGPGGRGVGKGTEAGMGVGGQHTETVTSLASLAQEKEISTFPQQRGRALS